MIGVSVKVKGTTLGGISDMDGRYSISVPNKNDILIVSFLATQQKKSRLTDGATLTSGYAKTPKHWTKVVGHGYGQQKRERRGIHEFGKAFGNRCPDSKFDQQFGRTSIRFNCRTTFR